MNPKFVFPARGPDALPGARIDFRALVAFLASAQAVQPSSRLAMRLAEKENRSLARREVLIALFAPERRGARFASRPDSAVLQGRFNVSVPIRDDALTESQAW